MTDVMSCDLADGGDLERASSNLQTNSLEDPGLAVGSLYWVGSSWRRTVAISRP